MKRLNKIISDSGFTSRRKAEEFILQGRVTVNGKTIYELATQVDETKDIVCVDGEKIIDSSLVYFLLNKPKGFITSTNDERGRRTVTELIKTNHRIFPVGRLDFNTTGLIVLSNDGDFCNLLIHPKNNVPRIYEAILDKPLSDEDSIKLMKGIVIERRRGKFLEIIFYKQSNHKLVRIKVSEGRNHFVKKMFSALGYNVVNLHRKSFAKLELGNLKYGEYRKLSKDEIKQIYEDYSL